MPPRDGAGIAEQGADVIVHAHIPAKLSAGAGCVFKRGAAG